MYGLQKTNTEICPPDRLSLAKANWVMAMCQISFTSMCLPASHGQAIFFRIFFLYKFNVFILIFKFIYNICSVFYFSYLHTSTLIFLFSLLRFKYNPLLSQFRLFFLIFKRLYQILYQSSCFSEFVLNGVCPYCKITYSHRLKEYTCSCSLIPHIILIKNPLIKTILIPRTDN